MEERALMWYQMSQSLGTNITLGHSLIFNESEKVVFKTGSTRKLVQHFGSGVLP